MTARRIHATVHGRVQGVGFRYFVQREAQRLGLCGWVRNLRDGSVEVSAEGSPDDLALLEEALNRGPGTARVTSVSVQHYSDLRGDTSFRIVV